MNFLKLLFFLYILRINAQTGAEDYIAELDEETQRGYFITYKDGYKNVEYIQHEKHLR